MSTKAPVHMFRPAYQTPELDAYLRETAAIDPSILAQDLGISAPIIRAYQRKLGVRPITGNPPRRERNIPD